MGFSEKTTKITARDQAMGREFYSKLPDSARGNKGPAEAGLFQPQDL